MIDGREIFEGRLFLMPAMIDRDRCTGCGICVFHCGVDALAMNEAGDKAELVAPCVDCFICEAVCPEDAITIKVLSRRVPSPERPQENENS